jgi:hypothetical protein
VYIKREKGARALLRCHSRESGNPENPFPPTSINTKSPLIPSGRTFRVNPLFKRGTNNRLSFVKRDKRKILLSNINRREYNEEIKTQLS